MSRPPRPVYRAHPIELLLVLLVWMLGVALLSAFVLQQFTRPPETTPRRTRPPVRSAFAEALPPEPLGVAPENEQAPPRPE